MGARELAKRRARAVWSYGRWGAAQMASGELSADCMARFRTFIACTVYRLYVKSWENGRDHISSVRLNGGLSACALPVSSVALAKTVQ